MTTRHGNWTISYDPPPIPDRSMDYVGVHEDYDGAPLHSEGSPSDHRCVRGASVADVVQQIEEMESE